MKTLCCDHFGRHPEGSADKSATRRFVATDARRHTKVGQLELATQRTEDISTLISWFFSQKVSNEKKKHQRAHFDVTMDDAVFVHVVETFERFFQRILAQRFTIVDMSNQKHSRNIQNSL